MGKSKKVITRFQNNKIEFRELESLADFGSEFWQEGEPIEPEVSRQLISDIAQSSETVDGIVRLKVNDIVNAGYRFIPAPGVKDAKDDHKDKLIEFFSHPNTEDYSGEWLESLVYDLVLQNDSYLEIIGSRDIKDDESGNCWFGGAFIGMWHIPCETILPIAFSETGQLPTDKKEMAYQQTVGMKIKKFNAEKVLRVAMLKRGRILPRSPLLSLLNVIAGQINLTGYIGNLYNGNIPRTLINVGKKNDVQFDRLVAKLQQQMNRAQNPYGMVAVNADSGFQVAKLMESSDSGQFIETLKYYREEIASVFGVPPSKLGYAVPGKIGSQTDMDDTYYDNIERMQSKLEKIIYNGIIKRLGYGDWTIKFNRVRPKQIKVESDARAKNARGIQVGRQEGIVSVNEARGWYELDPIEEDWANDPRYPSPVLQSKTQGGTSEPEEVEEEGEKAISHWPYIDEEEEVKKKIIVENRQKINQLKTNLNS